MVLKDFTESVATCEIAVSILVSIFSNIFKETQTFTINRKTVFIDTEVFSVFLHKTIYLLTASLSRLSLISASKVQNFSKEFILFFPF